METGTLFLIGIATAFNFIILYFFLRHALEVKKQIGNQEKQIKLLMKIAEKHGVTREEIYEAIGFSL